MRGRAFIKIIVGVVGVLVAAYQVTAFVTARRRDRAYRAYAEAANRLVDRGRAAPPPPALAGGKGALRAACAGRLEQVEPAAIVVYFRPTSPAVEAERKTSLSDAPSDVLATFSRVWGALELREKYLPILPGDLLSHWTSNLITSPNLWFEELSGSFTYIDVFNARYFIVSDIVAASFPSRTADATFEAGVAIVYSQVIDLKSGQAVCAGFTASSQPGAVGAQGSAPTYELSALKRELDRRVEAEMHRDFAVATIAAPIEAVCEAGGSSLCSAAKRVLSGGSLYE